LRRGGKPGLAVGSLRSDERSLVHSGWSEDTFQRGLAAARSFYEAHGHLNVPSAFVSDDGLRLRAWLRKRGEEWSSGKLAQSRKAALDELTPTWLRP
jgi:hypothetical protein